MTFEALAVHIEQAERRYEARTQPRAEARSRLREGGVLAADRPERVDKRLARLNADWGLAGAVASAFAPASVGAIPGQREPTAAASPASASLLALERVLGRNDLIDAGFLEGGYLAAGSVGRISVRGENGGIEHYGTGFLISPRLLLTNNHVLGDATQADRAYVEFNYQTGLDGSPLTPQAFPLDPGAFFVTHRDLDFTAVAVNPRGANGGALAEFRHLRLIEQEGKVILGELINIIQHPNGEPKQLALRENRLVDVLDDFLHYETDTAPGSSGSPVFNDQWEVVALHHAGVPDRDGQGRILAIDGSVWSEEMGEHRIKWKANEGARISRVLRALSGEPLTGEADRLRSEIFEAAPAAPLGWAASPSGGGRQPLAFGPQPRIGADGGSAVLGGVEWSLPLRVSIRLGDGAPAIEQPAAPPAPSAMGAARTPLTAEQRELDAALLDLEAARRRPYYSEAADAEQRERYYGGVELSGGGEALFQALSELVTRTHARRPRYKPMRLVYPWVDLHPDRKLRSVYSGRPFDPEEMIRADARVEAQRTGRLAELVLTEAALGPEELEAELLALEAALPYNCEHVVPQSWFRAREPMRGDLHHLFACESGCNSFRGNHAYFDFADFQEVVRHACGKREEARFEPTSGKGAVARAVLYFLLRYPGAVRTGQGRLEEIRLSTLLDWHRAEAVGDYERHRNMAIFELQGNRNPLIDHPELSDRVEFAVGLRLARATDVERREAEARGITA
jgi:endonuclease G